MFSNVFFHAFRYVLQLHPTRFGLSPIISPRRWWCCLISASKTALKNPVVHLHSSCFVMIYIQYLISASFFVFLFHQCTLPNPLIALPSPSITMVGSVCNWTNIMIRLPSQVLDLGVMIRLRFCERKKERSWQLHFSYTLMGFE